ncbi:hypothetical protein [Streptomyces aurantiogriseus]|uniref:hypothetical protein n=1 Tax=Streptomyces aurantiogriseus TaxID=66870 RepID=UPI00167A52E2|nr:hypothetical protein [Streptomyces aurantiogriseus]
MSTKLPAAVQRTATKRPCAAELKDASRQLVAAPAAGGALAKGESAVGAALRVAGA